MSRFWRRPAGRAAPATKYILVNDEGRLCGHLQPASLALPTSCATVRATSATVSPEYRGHGYATAGLKLTLAKARELGIKEAYLSVHKTNPASLAVQQHCGARIDHEDKTEYYTRIATCTESDGLYARAIDGASCV